MINEAERRGIPWRLLYLARDRQRMPYIEDLVRSHPSNTYVWPSNERGRYNLDDIWQKLPAENAHVYSWDHDELLVGPEDSANRHEADFRLVLERFAVRKMEHWPNRPIDVTLSRSGRTPWKKTKVCWMSSTGGRQHPFNLPGRHLRHL